MGQAGEVSHSPPNQRSPWQMPPFMCGVNDLQGMCPCVAVCSLARSARVLAGPSHPANAVPPQVHYGRGSRMLRLMAPAKTAMSHVVYLGDRR